MSDPLPTRFEPAAVEPRLIRAWLDSGLWQAPNQNYGARVLATIDVTNGGSGPVTGDPYGHGTHVTSIAAGGAMNVSGNYLGIAPQANLVIVRAFNGEGAGRYIDVINGLDWIVATREHNRDCRSRRHRSARCGATSVGCNHVHLATNEVSGQVRQSIRMAIGKSIFDGKGGSDGSANVAELDPVISEPCFPSASSCVLAAPRSTISPTKIPRSTNRW